MTTIDVIGVAGRLSPRAAFNGGQEGAIAQGGKFLRINIK
jgi:hypothetical protein